MRIAVVGATGEVGRTMVRVLQEQGVRPEVIRFFASSRSAGQTVKYFDRDVTVEELTPEWVPAGTFDYVIMSAGAGVSKWFAPIAAERGATVIDNSSCWRMDPEKLLVVPEINGDLLKGYHGIIANPNCSTIQMVLGFYKVHEKYGIKTIVVSTYQAVSGAGRRGMDELLAQEKGSTECKKFAAPIFRNVVPQIDDFLPDGFTKEEMKMVNEPRKILRDDSIMSWPTTVRVPVLYGHSESVFVETREPFGTIEDLLEVMRTQEHVVVSDQPVVTPAVDAAGTDTTFVSRVRSFDDRHFLQWNVADNVRVGAATNAVRILLKHAGMNGVA
ncbi:MAG: aspartate-semialdehyde dehydrogenase [Pyramidobacter sp.]|nr:aspartate-semialdehyde dehydrogenase [Pyramidobacter sp.]MBR0108465.1 aspartate-semialdehyde dehydrogenase [Pyramidobacter sp.]